MIIEVVMVMVVEMAMEMVIEMAIDGVIELVVYMNRRCFSWPFLPLE